MFDSLGLILVVFAVTHLMMVMALAMWPRAGQIATLFTVACAAGAGCVIGAWAMHGHLAAAAAPAAAMVGAVGVYARATRWLHPVGTAVWCSWLLLGAALLCWGGLFLAGLDVSRMTSSLLWSTAALSALTLPSAVIQTREGWEPLLRRRRRRNTRLPRSRRAVGRAPMVSVHVPCRSEPPEMVISTLNHLARLDYPNFEVLVIDNNTADPELWMPVAAHCQRLGGRFRFFHVEGITGAKAGALNWALAQVCPEAELIAVVDADYHVRPDWLRETVGYFADPTMGFVQCPHAYRAYSQSTLGRWANWEYAVFFATGMVSLDDDHAGITVGTMSLIRRTALVRVGGWATWCLTEDSELAIRIHAAGYQSVYLTEPYGRGLIPETFEGYRRQRHRWTYGPVQELQRHWRLFLPGRLAEPSALSAQQKIHHANHGLDVICIGLRALCLPLGAAAAASMVAHHERVPMPFPLWAAASCLLVGSVILRWLVYRRVLKATTRQALGGIVAFAALTHVITIASLQALIRRPARWRRTSKFRPRRRGARVLASVRGETALGLGGLVAAAMLAGVQAGGMGTALAIGLGVQAMAYLAAPVVAVAADRGLARVTEPAWGPSGAVRPPRRADQGLVAARSAPSSVRFRAQAEPSVGWAANGRRPRPRPGAPLDPVVPGPAFGDRLSDRAGYPTRVEGRWMGVQARLGVPPVNGESPSDTRQPGQGARYREWS